MADSKKQAVLTDTAPKPIGPYSQAIKSGGFLFCSGQIPLDPVTGQIVGNDIETQTRQAMKNLEALLKAAGCGFANVVKTNLFLKSMNDFPKVNEIYASFFPPQAGPPPARSTIEVARLPKDVLVEVEVIAAL